MERLVNLDMCRKVNHNSSAIHFDDWEEAVPFVVPLLLGAVRMFIQANKDLVPRPEWSAFISCGVDV